MAHENAKWSDAGETFIRISALASLSRCPGFMVADMVQDRPSKAADTGSLVGRVIQLWHENGEDPISFGAARDRAMREVAEHYPQADVEEAMRVSWLYACDERNYGTVVKGSCELEVRLVLDPDPEDPTGEPIRLLGHLDQVRRDQATRLQVWDMKNGAQPGLDISLVYTWQIAAYALAASEHYGQTVLPGGVIRLQGYGKKCLPSKAKDANVFFQTPWSLEACRGMMATVAHEIAMLRMGKVSLRPGIQCAWCPGGGPHLCGDFIQGAYPNGVSL